MKLMNLGTALALTALVWFSGCEGSDGGGDTSTSVAPYSCIFASGNCGDFIGTTYLNSDRRAVEKMGCESSGGTFQQDTACTTTGRVGVCIRDGGTSSERRTT